MTDNSITSITELKKCLETPNNNSSYCVSDWVSAPVNGEKVPVKITAIHHNGIEVSNSRYVKLSLLSSDVILQRLLTLLSESRSNYSTTPALCMQYASLLIEIDNAIVRLNIDCDTISKFILPANEKSSVELPFMKVNYKDWADKFSKSKSNWKYQDFESTNDVCYFNPGFDYEQFQTKHNEFWRAINDKIDVLCEILIKINTNLSASPGYHQTIQESQQEATSKDDVSNIYISYSWSSCKEMDLICSALQKNKIPYHRDLIDCGYRQNIKNFENEIGKGNWIIVFINAKYLRSIHCMYELALISETGDISKRVFPIVSDDLDFDIHKYYELVSYWETEFNGRKEILQHLNSGTSLQAIDELSYCDKISRELPLIWKYLTDHNRLKQSVLMENNCEKLGNSIKTTIAKEET